jgi:hypothetical protein
MKNKIKKKVGKPTFYTEPMGRVNVMLDPETIAFYKQAGAGNLSEGIRQAWRGLTPFAPDKSGLILAQSEPVKEVSSPVESGAL